MESWMTQKKDKFADVRFFPIQFFRLKTGFNTQEKIHQELLISQQLILIDVN